MPMDKARYPEDWPAISRAIRVRDGWKCKFCAVPAGAYIKRNYVPSGLPTPFFFAQLPKHKVARMEKGRLWYREQGGTKVILTVAHLGAPLPDGTPGDPHNKKDVRDENLAALCQRCHLMFDLDDHIANAARTRRAKRVGSGQGELV